MKISLTNFYSLLDNETSFIINIPRDPFITINYKPQILLMEFLVYVLSCFGTWFGISVFKLNPIPFFKQVCQSQPSPRRQRFSTQAHQLRSQDHKILMLRNRMESRHQELSAKIDVLSNQ